MGFLADGADNPIWPGPAPWTLPIDLWALLRCYSHSSRQFLSLPRTTSYTSLSYYAIRPVFPFDSLFFFLMAFSSIDASFVYRCYKVHGYAQILMWKEAGEWVRDFFYSRATRREHRGRLRLFNRFSGCHSVPNFLPNQSRLFYIRQFEVALHLLFFLPILLFLFLASL